MATLFEAAGASNAPALILVHGSVVTHKMWLPQLRGLSDVYHVIAPDLPGHGALADIPFSFAAAVHSLAELIRQEAQGRALVAGLSLGGYVAIELAYRFPDLAAGLVLSGCSFNFDGIVGLYLKVVSGMAKRGWIKQNRAQAEEKTRRMFPPALADVADAQLKDGVYPDALGPAFAEMAGVDFSAHLASYPRPGLILNGEKDMSPRRGEAKFIARMQHGRIQTIAGAGHACNIDQPEAYNQAVRDFGKEIHWLP